MKELYTLGKAREAQAEMAKTEQFARFNIGWKVWVYWPEDSLERN